LPDPVPSTHPDYEAATLQASPGMLLGARSAIVEPSIETGDAGWLTLKAARPDM